MRGPCICSHLLPCLWRATGWLNPRSKEDLQLQVSSYAFCRQVNYTHPLMVNLVRNGIDSRKLWIGMRLKICLRACRSIMSLFREKVSGNFGAASWMVQARVAQVPVLLRTHLTTRAVFDLLRQSHRFVGRKDTHYTLRRQR